MRTFIINENEAGQRLDRYLKKYLIRAPLSFIYRVVRKDVKINGRREGIDYMLHVGDEVTLYLADEQIDDLSARREKPKARKRFNILFEDENILAADKPFGLLTHGDCREKKDTLTNEVVAYLLDAGEYDPGADKLFTPASVNRLDRNTSGIVLFGKRARAVRDLNAMIRHGFIDKYYQTIVKGKLTEELTLQDRMVKDERTNRVTVLPGLSGAGRSMETLVHPVESLGEYTLVEVLLVTGRPHQIRAHLAYAGYPVLGDAKYGDSKANDFAREHFDLTTQYLHAHRLVFRETMETLTYLKATEIVSPLPPRLATIAAALRP